jgi:hypothetical protein
LNDAQSVRFRLRTQHQSIFDIGHHIVLFWQCCLDVCIEDLKERQSKDHDLRLVYVSPSKYKHMQMKSLRSYRARSHAVVVGRDRSLSVVVGRGRSSSACWRES